MKHSLLVFCFCTLHSTIAQPVITMEHAPQPGDQCAYGNSTESFEIPDQPGWILELSGSDFEPSPYSYTYVHPSSTQGASLFPNANLALQSSTGGYEFYQVGPTGIQVLGYQAGADHSIMTDPLLLMVYPCHVGISWSDTYAYTGSWDTDSGTVEWEAFTHGVIGLNGVYLPVLVLRTEYSQTDEVQGDIWQAYTTDLRFYSPLSRCELGTGTIAHFYLNGVYHNSFHHLTMLLNPDLGVGNEAASPTTIRVWPVPASHELAFDRKMDDRNAIVQDALGRSVMEQALHPGDPVGSLRIDALIPGHYTLKVSSTSGRSRHARFMVE